MSKEFKIVAGIATLALVVAVGVAIYVGGAVNRLEKAIESAGVDLGAKGTRFPNGISADTTSPLTGEVRGTTLTITATTTLTQSVDGLVVGGTFSTAATGTVRTVYTNSTGPKICDASTGHLFSKTNGSFAPSVVFSVGTSTTAISSTNLIASSTKATTTNLLASPLTSLFLLDNGDLITAIMGDVVGAGDASSTNFANLSAEFGVWCQDLSI